MQNPAEYTYYRGVWCGLYPAVPVPPNENAAIVAQLAGPGHTLIFDNFSIFTPGGTRCTSDTVGTWSDMLYGNRDMSILHTESYALGFIQDLTILDALFRQYATTSYIIYKMYEPRAMHPPNSLIAWTLAFQYRYNLLRANMVLCNPSNSTCEVLSVSQLEIYPECGKHRIYIVNGQIRTIVWACGGEKLTPMDVNKRSGAIICKLSTSAPIMRRNHSILTKFISDIGQSSVYIYTIDKQWIRRRIYGPHLSLLSGYLVSRAQADIYNAMTTPPADDDTLTYDD